MELTPTSTIYSPLLTDIEKFGTPGTRYSILAEAQSNIIWEATDIDDDDDGGTSMATSVTTPISSSYVSKSTKVTPIIRRNFDDNESENIEPPDQNSPHRNNTIIHPNSRGHDSPNKLSSMAIIIDNTLGHHHHHHHHQPIKTTLESSDELLLYSTQDDDDNNNVHHHHHIFTNASSSSSKFNQITLCKNDNDQMDQKYVNNHLAQMNVMKRIQHFDALSAKRPTPLKLSLPTSSSLSSLPTSSSLTSFSSSSAAASASSSSSLISTTIPQSPALNRLIRSTPPLIDATPAPHSIHRGLPELRQQHARTISRDG